MTNSCVCISYCNLNPHLYKLRNMRSNIPVFGRRRTTVQWDMRKQHLSVFCSCLQGMWSPMCPFPWDRERLGSTSRITIDRFLQVFSPLQYLKEMGNDLKLPATVPAHCTVVGFLPRTMWLKVAILARGCLGSTYVLTIFDCSMKFVYFVFCFGCRH